MARPRERKATRERTPPRERKPPPERRAPRGRHEPTDRHAHPDRNSPTDRYAQSDRNARTDRYALSDLDAARETQEPGERHGPSEREKRSGSPVLVAIAAFLAFLVFVFLLTRAAVPMITALSVVSFNEPRVYAALLALLAGLPGLLFTLPRATRRPEPHIPPSPHRRRERPAKKDSFVRTDALGLAALMLAQVPVPPPWSPTGKAATVANVTENAEIVQLSRAFAVPSLAILAMGVAAAVIAQVYRHAPGWRVISIILAVSAPVLGWFYLTRTTLM